MRRRKGLALEEMLSGRTIEASAPCRVDLGGTMDLASFHYPLRHEAPCTVNIALGLRTRIVLKPYTSGRVKISSEGIGSVEASPEEAPYDHPLGLMLAVTAWFGVSGVHARIVSASPPRSGLGGSSVAAVALIAAYAKGLADSAGTGWNRSDIAALAHGLESAVAGVPCGMQDQLAAAYGGVNLWHWRATPGKKPFSRNILIPAKSHGKLARRMLVAYCGKIHASGPINATWVQGFLKGRNRGIWKEINACCRKFSEAIADFDVEYACSLMNKETDLRLEMTPDVLTDDGKNLVAAARRANCGARFTGAGGGGCIWALGEPDNIDTLRGRWRQIVSEVEDAELLPVAIDGKGVTAGCLQEDSK